MKKISFRNRIRDRFKELYQQDSGRWIVKEEVCRFAQKLGYSSENAGRRLRELESGKLSNGKIIPIELEVRYAKGSRGQELAWYRYKPLETYEEMNRRSLELFDSIPS